MKAKLKHNGEIIDVIQVGTKTHLFDINNVEFIDAPVDYWEKLKHQYAGMAMQGILSNQNIGADVAYIVSLADEVAHALIEKLKEKEE